MRSLSVVLTAALFLVVSVCSKDVNPDTPPPPHGPEISKVGVNCTFRVTASDTDYDRVSVRIDWDNGDTSDWSELFRSDDTIALTYAWPAAGDFRISAQAKDEKGAVSLWSNWHVVVIKDTANVPPGMPSTPTGPDTGYFDSTYEFSTLADDPNGDRILLQFDWGDGDTSEWSGMVPEGTQITMSHAWRTAGEYSVVARARDEKGLVSGWSNVHIMVAIEDTVNQPPEIPLVPAGPDAGHVDSTYEFSTAGGDPNGDSIMFQFDWGDGDTSAWSAPVAESTVVSMAHSWSVAGEFSVRARAKDERNLVSDWSNAHLLTINDSLWNRLRMVDTVMHTPDGKAFLIKVMNDGTQDATVSWLTILPTSEPLYMREFRIGADWCGTPLPPGTPGYGPGTTVSFTPPGVTIAPNGLVDLYFGEFHVDPTGVGDTSVFVTGREFEFRFSDGSEIAVRP